MIKSNPLWILSLPLRWRIRSQKRIYTRNLKRHNDFVTLQNSLLELDLYEEPDRDVDSKEFIVLQKAECHREYLRSCIEETLSHTPVIVQRLPRTTISPGSILRVAGPLLSLRRSRLLLVLMIKNKSKAPSAPRVERLLFTTLWLHQISGPQKLSVRLCFAYIIELQS